MLIITTLGIYNLYINKYNENLKKNFQEDDFYSEYKNMFENLDLNIESLNLYGQFISSNIPMEVTLKKEILYYSEPNENATVLYKLKKGETYYVAGYPRYVSWPTNDREWRYSLPLLKKNVYTNGVVENDNFLQGECAYIKTEDLEYILKCYQRQLHRNNLSGKMFFEFNDDPLYIIDRNLYDKGIYISPNLYKRQILDN